MPANTQHLKIKLVTTDKGQCFIFLSVLFVGPSLKARRQYLTDTRKNMYATGRRSSTNTKAMGIFNFIDTSIGRHFIGKSISHMVQQSVSP